MEHLILTSNLKRKTKEKQGFYPAFCYLFNQAEILPAIPIPIKIIIPFICKITNIAASMKATTETGINMKLYLLLYASIIF